MELPFYHEETAGHEDALVAQQRLDAYQPVAGFANLLHYRILWSLSHAGFPGNRFNDVSAEGGLRRIGYAIHLFGKISIFPQVSHRAIKAERNFVICHVAKDLCRLDDLHKSECRRCLVG